MSAFSKEQTVELDRLVNSAIQLGTRSANVYTVRTVADAIVAERERLAHIVETCRPFIDLGLDDPTGVKEEVPDFAATLRALGRAIRTGKHE
jgi:hypothetical protein